MKIFGRYQIDVSNAPRDAAPYRWRIFEIGASEPFLISRTGFRTETAAFSDARNVISRHADRRHQAASNRGKAGR